MTTSPTVCPDRMSNQDHTGCMPGCMRICRICKVQPACDTKKRPTYCKECNSLRTVVKQHKFKDAQLDFYAHRDAIPKGTCIACGELFHPCQLGIWTPPGVHYEKISLATGTVPLTDYVRDLLTERDLLCLNCLRAKRGSNSTPLKEKALDYLGGACTKCNIRKPTSALEFHHKDREAKQLQLGTRGIKSWFQIEPELDLCEIMCVCCHTLEHFTENQQKRLDHIKKYKLDKKKYIIYI